MFARAVVVVLCVLVVISDGAKAPNCSKYLGHYCTKDYSPVCGTNGVTYGNECEMCGAIKASKTKIRILKRGECRIKHH